MFALAAASSLITFLVQRDTGATASLANVPLGFRFANAVLACQAYLLKTLWPRWLACFYPLNSDVSAWPYAAAVLAGLTALAIWQRGPRPYLLMGWLWFLGTLVPVIGIVQVGDQAYADRYTYLPLVGLFIAIVWGAWDIARGANATRVAAPWAGICVIVALAARSWYQVGIWRDTSTLATHALDVVPLNPKAQLLLAVNDFNHGDMTMCIERCRQSLAAQPDDPIVLNRMALAYADLKDDDAAARAWEQSLAILQDMMPSNRLAPDVRYREAIYNLALLRLRQGRAADGLPLLTLRLNATPQDSPTLAALAIAHNMLNQPDAAAHDAEAALRITPNQLDAQHSLALARAAQGRTADAKGILAAILRRDPLDLEANTQLADISRREGDLAVAATCLRNVLTRQPLDAASHFKLGAILQQQQKFKDAVAEYYRAIELNPASAARNNLAWLRATCSDPTWRNGPEAMRLAQALAAGPNGARADVLDTLAAAQAEVGKFDDAVATARKAAQSAHDEGKVALGKDILARATIYESHKPYRDMPAQ